MDNIAFPEGLFRDHDAGSLLTDIFLEGETIVVIAAYALSHPVKSGVERRQDEEDAD